MRIRQFAVAAANAVVRKPRIGCCPICAKRSAFAQVGANAREALLCVRCRSSPRGRAMLLALDRSAPNWRGGEVYEAGPSGPLSRYLANECRALTTSFYLSDVPSGQIHNGMRSENLERLTFDDESFDVVVTQDVLEHVLQPRRALAEIARVLRPNGSHVFTVPYSPTAPTASRAESDPDGKVVLLAPPEYHVDPLDPAGVLVITDWGNDLPDIVREVSALRTEVLAVADASAGIPDPVTVFVSRKRPPGYGEGESEA